MARTAPSPAARPMTVRVDSGERARKGGGQRGKSSSTPPKGGVTVCARRRARPLPPPLPLLDFSLPSP